MYVTLGAPDQSLCQSSLVPFPLPARSSATGGALGTVLGQRSAPTSIPVLHLPMASGHGTLAGRLRSRAMQLPAQVFT